MKVFPVRLQRLPFLLLRRFMRSFERPRYLLKWVVISTLIGMVAGVGAIAFYAAMHLATGLFLEMVVGYLPPDAAGEGTTRIMSLWAAVRPWLLPVVTTFGGLLAGIIVLICLLLLSGYTCCQPIFAIQREKNCQM